MKALGISFGKKNANTDILVKEALPLKMESEKQLIL